MHEEDEQDNQVVNRPTQGTMAEEAVGRKLEDMASVALAPLNDDQ
jgi:hypothetical protein